MSYDFHLSWMLEDRILFGTLEGDLAAAPDEFLQKFDREIKSYLDEATVPKVHVMADLSRATSLPHYKVMSKAFTFPNHPRYGWVMIVGMSLPPLVNLMTFVMAQIFHSPFRQVKTVDDGLAFLQKVDATLPDLSVLADWENPRSA